MAKAYEKPFEGSGNTFTWSERESLIQLEQPERVQAIKDEHAKRQAAKEASGADLTLAEVYRRRQVQTEAEGGHMPDMHVVTNAVVVPERSTNAI